jgi:peptidoglycan/LPS O-acetylase OafA/YrhL
MTATPTAPSTTTAPLATDRFPLVNGVRALAALSVLVYHVGEIGGFHEGAGAGFGEVLSFGVPLFFVISGFLLYRPFVRARDAGARPVAVAQYGLKRALRILPAYWVALTLLTLQFDLPGVFTSDWWRYYGLLQIYDADTYNQGMGVAWTLCVEATFYLFLPLYAWLTARSSPRQDMLVLAGLGVGSLLFAAALTLTDTGEVFVGTLPGTFLWFAAGMAIAVISVNGRQIERRTAMRMWIGAALLLAALGALESAADGDGVFLVRHLLVTAVGALILFPAVTMATGPQRLLGRLGAWLGLISYSVYLYHATLIPPLAERNLDTGFWVLPYLVLLAGTLCVVIPVAAASYYMVERPFERLKPKTSTGR